LLNINNTNILTVRTGPRPVLILIFLIINLQLSAQYEACHEKLYRHINSLVQYDDKAKELTGEIPAYFTVTGTVRDVSTGKPVAFASVSLKGGYLGIVSNLDGEFTLKVPADIKGCKKVISISHIGYKRADFSIDEIPAGGREYVIEPQSLQLEEVMIKPADARSIVAGALNRVGENYPEVPYRLTGFYRETIRQRRDYVSISEAVVDIYQAPYNSDYENDGFRIIQGRKSGQVKKADTLLVKLQGGPHVSMLLDIIKNPHLLISKESINYYTYDLTDLVITDSGTSYVIAFRPRVKLSYPLFYGNLHISADRLAITMAEFSLDLSDKSQAAQSFILRKPARLRFNPVNTKYMVQYKEVNGRYYVDYLRYELEFLADWRRRFFRTGYTIMSEMAITSRTDKDVQKFSSSEAFRPATILSDQVNVFFDNEFWGEYNFIEPDQSINAAIRKLNRMAEDW
jgi:hypothetical protein